MDLLRNSEKHAKGCLEMVQRNEDKALIENGYQKSFSHKHIGCLTGLATNYQQNILTVLEEPDSLL